MFRCKTLDKQEETCVKRCAEKFLKHFNAGSSVSNNKGMVEHLQRYGIIQSKKVAEIMETVDTKLLVPDGSPAYDTIPCK
ncbi:hypothetical protein SSX86_032553 [Deinandra increscens subsp. villosa]|uniref:Mitochondrial import inner membrane translocase subunit n=1 Tax=Deinandra increscens subsp. villosa TaxID=3103831 RepID=A0AAP0C4T4_9ASTR